MVAELFTEIFHEISAHPQTFAIEVVQFGLLLLIVKVVALGFGKKQGFVKNMLKERQARVAAMLEQAEEAPVALAAAQEEAAARIAAARAEAASVLLEARADTRSMLASTKAEADYRNEQMRIRAEETLSTEFDEMHAEIRDRLVELVAGATRSILNESFALSEQRALIQKAIIAGIERMESDDASSRNRALVGEGESA